MQCAWHRSVLFQEHGWLSCAAWKGGSAKLPPSSNPLPSLTASALLAASKAGGCDGRGCPNVTATTLATPLQEQRWEQAGDLCKGSGSTGLGEDPLLTAVSCGWCRDAAGPAPHRSGGWDQPGAPAVAQHRQRAPHGRLHAEGPSPLVPDWGQPDDAGGAAGRRCGPGWQRCTAVCSAPACIPVTTVLQG